MRQKTTGPSTRKTIQQIVIVTAPELTPRVIEPFTTRFLHNAFGDTQRTNCPLRLEPLSTHSNSYASGLIYSRWEPLEPLVSKRKSEPSSTVGWFSVATGKRCMPATTRGPQRTVAARLSAGERS